MAATPLFQTFSVLLPKLRLSNLPSTGDVNEIVDQAILDTRLDFYRRLGVTVVNQLVALPSTPTPTTEAQVKRSLAESVEVKMVRLNLMCTLPVSFQDAGGDINQRWNQEAPFRDLSLEEVKMEKSRLATDIEQAFKTLSEEDQIGEEIQLRVLDGTPTNAPPAPLDSVRIQQTRRSSDD